jgi:hypothetical protein
MRGFLRGVFDLPGPKTWRVELIESVPLWHDMLFEQLHPDLDSRAHAVRRVREFRETHERGFNRHYVYFICTRPRVRFSESEPCRIVRPGVLEVYLRVGSERDQRKYSVPLPILKDPETLASSHVAAVENTPKGVTLTFDTGQKMTFPAHDFGQLHGVNLGGHSHVRYVGYTKDPDVHIVRGEHKGLTRVLARTREDATDVFVYFNAFSVRALASDEGMNAEFVLSNAMTDEVNIKAEGLLLEKVFIDYFAPDCQGDLEHERAELRTRLTTLKEKHRITRVDVSFAVEDPDEYFVFGSDVVRPAPEHNILYDGADRTLSGRDDR